MKKIYCLFLLLVNTYLVAQTPFWQDNFENATTPDIVAGSTRTTSINAGSTLPSTSYFKLSNNTVGDGPEMTITLSEITKSIPGTGSALKIHEPVDLNGTGEEWAIDNFRVLETASSQTLSTAPTLTFTSDTGISSDNIATDGDGGAVSISDININITNISDVNGTFATPLSWENTVFYGSGSYTGLTKNIGSAIGTKGMMIKSGDGSEFRLEQFQYLNWGELSSITNTIKGYRNGTEVATQTFEGYNASFIATTITLSSAFQNVDEVRFYISSIGYIPDGSSTNHSINAIKVSSPVLTPEINVQGNSMTILDGDNTPDVSDNTNFGNVIAGSNLVRTFTVQNIGTGNLTVSSITSSNPLFTISALSPASPIGVSNSSTFTVTFSPTAVGSQTSTITINNNDGDEAVYNFDIKGNGLQALTSLSINGPSTSLLGSPTTFIATLNRVSAPAGPLSGQTVSFTITLPNASNQTGSVTTDANGEANYMFTSSLVGIHSVNASFLGNATHTASSSSALSHDVLIPCTPPNYTFTGASNVEATDPSLATNWLNGCVPSMNDSAIIITVNSGKTFKASTPIAGSIVNNGTITGSLNLAGSLTNNGLLSPGN